MFLFNKVNFMCQLSLVSAVGNRAKSVLASGKRGGLASGHCAVVQGYSQGCTQERLCDPLGWVETGDRNLAQAVDGWDS